ncbi:MAG: transposase [Saccharofermentans sp.]|nr:transposase [Saccharofermentans sp.]
MNMKNDVRISEKVILSLSEASAYSGIGIHKLQRLASEPGCDFVIYVGSRKCYKRKKLEEFLEKSEAI